MEKFEAYFSSVYGSRWPALKQSLQGPDYKVKRVCFQADEFLTSPFELNSAKAEEKPGTESDKSQVYIMDPSSIIAAQSLKPTPGSKVLDMCSAPGGKGLILLEYIRAQGQIVFNEPSRIRRDRLKNVLRTYAPKKYLDIATVQGRDGITFGINSPDYFDYILVDAPCSGERHLLQAPSELKKWSLQRTKRLAAQQYGLLCSALLALKSNGALIYSTCSISPLENDGVIERLLSKKGESFFIDPDFVAPRAEKTEFGYIYLPDTTGHGPLFLTRLIKK